MVLSLSHTEKDTKATHDNHTKLRQQLTTNERMEEEKKFKLREKKTKRSTLNKKEVMK